ncbi:FkbM family methyltransferase [Winogradskyella sp. KYW1333]|uniref:FkbM family methyltransferase n=1 Tax=Winogradskyella sp. KYW1333 TaxID=2282123 RepID=UPI0015F098ED|nr:FkbM family methyltransferase [Winogradskyella sp. KYW1333]
MSIKSFKQHIRERLYKRYNISFSKSGDDIQLHKLIKAKSPGIYVDIGCWHPTKASNTYYFYLRGWKGLCIDPNPELKELYNKTRPNDSFLNFGVGNSEDLEYYMLEEPHSSMNTLNLDFLKKHNLTNKIKKTIIVPTYSLRQILDESLTPNDRLDFFDVDVEGFDLEVLKTNDWNKYRPKVIIVESDMLLKKDITSPIVKYLESKNYKFIGKSIIMGDLGNLFLIDQKQI